MWLSIAIAAASSVFAAFILGALFRGLDVNIVKDGYVACLGGWHEAKLRNCLGGLHALPQQPVNTYTNLAYLAGGIYVAAEAQPGAMGPSLVFAVTMTYLCIGSALYHALSSKWAGMLDVTAIYAVYSSLLLLSITELLGWAEEWRTVVSLVGCGAIAYFLSPRFRDRMNLRIGIFLGGTYVCVVIGILTGGSRDPVVPLVSSLACFLLAFGAWLLDKRGVFPLKRWGHGVWHILTAIASVLAFIAVEG